MFPSFRRQTWKAQNDQPAWISSVPLFSNQHLNAKITSEPPNLAQIDNSEDGEEQTWRHSLVFSYQYKKSQDNPFGKTCLSRHDNQVVISRRDIN